MKRIFLLVAVVLPVVISCSRGYVISGNAPDDSTVVLSYGDESISAPVENGSFSIKGEVADPLRGEITLMPQNGEDITLDIILENCDIAVDFESKEIAGGPLSAAEKEFDSTCFRFMNEFHDQVDAVLADQAISDETRWAKRDAIFNAYCVRCDSLYEAFFEANKDNILAVDAIFSLNRSKAAFDSLCNLCSDVVKNDPRIIAEQQRYEVLERTSVGKMFTDFTVEHGAADGTACSLGDYVGKGKYVLVDFWASWCGPCCAEVPNIAQVYKKYKGDEFEIVGVAVNDKREATLKKMEELSIVWPVIFETGSIATDAYGILGIPEIMLFGPDGRIVAKGLRGEQIGEFLAGIFPGK